MKKFLFIILLLLPSAVLGAGFVPDAIWLSNASPDDGEVIDIYVTIFNSDAATLKGDIRYYDQDMLIGEIPVIVSSQSAKFVPLSWEAVQGDRVIYAQFSPEEGVMEETKKIRFRVKKPIIPTPVEPATDESDTSKNSEQGSFGEIANEALDTGKRLGETGFEASEVGRDSLLERLEKSKVNVEDKKEVLLSGGVEDADSQFKYDTKKVYLSVLLWMLSALIFVVGTKALFYVAIILIVFFGIRLFVRRRREYDYE